MNEPVKPETMKWGYGIALTTVTDEGGVELIRRYVDHLETTSKAQAERIRMDISAIRFLVDLVRSGSNTPTNKGMIDAINGVQLHPNLTYSPEYLTGYSLMSEILERTPGT